ncbi:hypothetical protein FRC10_009158 [Ceratobasidium sp. 414]|nr:hypothetical protein FRC10_009158 [Ceratobasidium sp. 414]
MSHPVFWPSKTFFYPIGNTAAISLTQDLSPEQPADILLLGCGDPRNILFTLYADVVVPPKNEHIERVWDIFYHFKIGDQASKILTRQSRRLYDTSNSIETWRKSSYGSFLKFVDARTLVEVRRHWKNYADFPRISPARLSNLRQEQARLSKSVLAVNHSNISPSRSAGMLWMEAAIPMIELFKRYWETGTTFVLDGDIKNAKNLNPTFVYSTPGEVFDPHYGTFPQGFHLTPAFVPIVSDATRSNTSKPEAVAVDVMKQQFKAWGDAFRASRAAGAITLRFYSGDAIAFCRALDVFASTSQAATGIHVSTWRASQINLAELRANTPPAPTSFDVVDTSNLTDHLGLLNLLLVTRPLLKSAPESQAVLYTETLLSSGEDATKSFLDRICATVPTISTLLCIAPRAYLASFSTVSNTHELLSPEKTSQFHERVAWVDPTGGDRYASQQKIAVSFDAKDLARVIFGFYDKMFASEQVMAAMFARPSLAKLKSMMEVNYHRETVAALLQFVKRRIHLHTGNWDMVALEFLAMIEDDRSRLVGMNNYQDLCLQLHLYGVHTVPPLERDWQTRFGAKPTSKIFRGWPNVPPMLCVVLTVPRKNLQVLLADRANTGTPTLQCNLTAQGIHSNAYSALHIVWGTRVITPNSNNVTLKEDTQGSNGTSGLVVSFWASSRILEFEDTYVNFAIKSTPQSTMLFAGKLGLGLTIFAAKLDDKKHVRLLPYHPSLGSEQSAITQNAITRFAAPVVPNDATKIVTGLGRGAGSRNVVSFTARISVGPIARKALLNGADVTAEQILPCTMQLSIGGHQHYLSDREREIRNGNDAAKSVASNVLVNVKDSIHTIVALCSSHQEKEPLAVGLCEPNNGGIYAILLVGGLRLDLASFTVIVDTALVPLSTKRMYSLIPSIKKLQDEHPVIQVITMGHEAVAWKKLLPAYVERCRTWKHKAKCEYAGQGEVPLSVKMDENPICTCGEGFGFEGPEWKPVSWEGLLPFATRAAISPLFSVSYIETVAGRAQGNRLRISGWGLMRIFFLLCAILLVYRTWLR